jgi:hypothetical protein
MNHGLLRRSLILVAFSILLFALLWVLFRNGPSAGIFPGCLLHKWTGLHCPGCGMTRATYASLHGRWGDAFRLNPLLMLLLPILMVGLLLELIGWLRGRPLPWRMTIGPKTACCLIVLMLVYGVLRNIPYWPCTLLAPH